MTIRKIIVPVRGDGKGEGLIDHALALASTSGAHIEVVHSHSQPKDMLPFGTLMITSAMKKSILEAAAANAEGEENHLRKIFDRYCESHDLLVTENPRTADGQVSISWTEQVGAQANVVSMRGRLADLIVVAKPDADTSLGVNTLESALLETGKLVMMVPEVRSGHIGHHIAIAWNGDSRAARTITLGLSILQNAEKVSILSAEKAGSDRLGGAELVEYLGWHGVEAELVKFDSSGKSVGEAILGTVDQIEADSVMMGGYGHSRRRELILGGVTQHIIEKTPVPIFMAH